MPSVFLSYDNDDLQLIKPLADALAAQDVTVWRDKDKLHGGQKWPKALGEAIASHDFFLLAWSENAARSHFVEFEWNTAIALKKTIIPCLLDKTPLPVSLSADQGIPVENPRQAVPTILAALQQKPAQADQARASVVIRQLADIKTTKEKEVVREAKAIFADDKGLLDRWQTRVALAVGVLTALSLAADLPGKLGFAIFSTAEKKEQVPENLVFDQPFAGQVVDVSTGEPVVDVQVSLLGFDQEKITDQNGYFRFAARGTKQQAVRFTLRKKEYKVETYSANLGNTEPPLIS